MQAPNVVVRSGSSGRRAAEQGYRRRDCCQQSYCYSYLYSRLRDGNGCAAGTMEPECLMLSK